MKILMLTILAAGLAAAQTTLTYDLTGYVCGKSGPQACTFHFADGSRWDTGQFVSYVYQIPGAIEPSGVYCTPFAGNWTITSSTFTFGCNDANGHPLMSAALQAHETSERVCNGRFGCQTVYAWIVDSGIFMVILP